MIHSAETIGGLPGREAGSASLFGYARLEERVARRGGEFEGGMSVITSGIHEFAPRDASGAPHPLAQYRGRVLLIVNTASRCGFTPQYEGLEALWRRHRAAGLVVLGLPCNQFGAQEPGDAEAIRAFCTTQYDVTFPVLSKVAVNGADAEPLYAHLKRAKPGLLGSRAIKWNFTKFLVGRDGRVIARFSPSTKPAGLEAAVTKALTAPMPA